jgi:protein TonB
VGNTLNTKPTNKATGPVQPLTGSPTGDPDALPAPVPEYLIAEDVRVLQEVTAPFPPEAQRMGIEGKVKLRVLIGPTGEVLKVTVLEKAGHGFDDLARDALKKFKFSPARTQDGKAVTRAIVYTYKFEQAQ